MVKLDLIFVFGLFFCEVSSARESAMYIRIVGTHIISTMYVSTRYVSIKLQINVDRSISTRKN